MVSRVIPVDNFDLVIFGGTGDLARRKIFPGLYRRFLAGQMNADSRIIGAARARYTDDEFRAFIQEALVEFVAKDRQEPDQIAAFLARLHYVAVDAKEDGGWDLLKSTLRQNVVRAFYFSVAPSIFPDLAERLHSHGITDAWSRIVWKSPLAATWPRPGR